MEKIIITEGQTLIDLAVRIYGSAESVFDLAFQNGLSVSDTLKAGTQISYDPKMISNKTMVDYMRKNTLEPATGSKSEEIFEDKFSEEFE